MLATVVTQHKDWVLLSYRIPREPSTPRIAVWRQLKELGVVQVGDGLVTLPKTVRNRERLQWVAARILEAEGEAIVWDAAPSSKGESKALALRQEQARTSEYGELLDAIQASSDPGIRTIQKWRRDWRKIDRRDYFDAPLREEVRAAIEERVEARMTNEAASNAADNNINNNTADNKSASSAAGAKTST